MGRRPIAVPDDTCAAPAPSPKRPEHVCWSTRDSTIIGFAAAASQRGVLRYCEVSLGEMPEAITRVLRAFRVENERLSTAGKGLRSAALARNAALHLRQLGRQAGGDDCVAPRNARHGVRLTPFFSRFLERHPSSGSLKTARVCLDSEAGNPLEPEPI